MVTHPDRGEHPLTSRVRLIPATDDPRFVPSVTVAARAIEGSRVTARATVSGGTPPYSFLWGGSNPNTSIERGAAVSYEPLTRDLREILPAQSLRRTEHVSVTVVDANGVSQQADTSLLVTARPAPDTHNSVTYGCESPNDPGAWTGDRVAWQNAMSTFGGGSERFCWLADSSWPGDYIEPNRPARSTRIHGSPGTPTTKTGASTRRTSSSTSATPIPMSSPRCIRAPPRPSTTPRQAHPFWRRTLRSPWRSAARTTTSRTPARGARRIRTTNCNGSRCTPATCSKMMRVRRPHG